MISHFNPILDPVLYYLLFLFIGYLSMFFESEDGVLLLENGIGWGVQSVERMFQWCTISTLRT
jgi:hypothetical protein